MMKKLCLALALTVFSALAFGRDFTLLTSEPARKAKAELSAEELFIEVIKEVFERSGLGVRVEQGPWIKAQRTVMRSVPEDRFLIAPITRIAEREDKFDWVLPLTSYTLQFVTTDKAMDLSNVDALRKEEVCVWRESAAEFKLKEWEFPDIISRVQVQKCFKDLMKGRQKVVLAHGERVARALYEQVGGKPDELILGRPFTEYTVYLAATRGSINEALKEQLLNALDEMKIDGTYEAIFSKYK